MENEEVFAKMDMRDSPVKKERKKYGIGKVVSHHDVYEQIVISTEEGDFNIVDWEYSCINDPINDVTSTYRYIQDNIDDVNASYGGIL